ncbi:hypothetical protein Tco_1188997, partial [Tanacetum coccineum]
CNFHDKKSQEPKLKNVVNTGQREGKPVWDNTKTVNHQNFSKYPHLSETFVPLEVLTRTGLHRPSVSTARPVSTVRPSVNTTRPVNTTSTSISTARPVYVTRPIYPRIDNVRPRGSCSPIKRSYYTKLAFRPKDLKQDVKTFGVQNMTTTGTRALVNTGKVDHSCSRRLRQSRTKHIEIRFHFIRDCYDKRLIEVIKIHTDHNVAYLLTKGFDLTRFNFLVVSIGLLNIESLERDIDGTKELLLPDLFILWLTKVSTDCAKLVPLGKDSTAIKPLEKIPPRV